MVGLEVLELLGSALYQDHGRGHVTSGVPVSGAFDRQAHVAALALVGGPVEGATLEVTGTLRMAVPVPLTCAVTGNAQVRVDGVEMPSWTVLGVRAGSQLTVRGAPRAYLAAPGGFPVAPVLGSRSTCLLGPVGPAPVRTGDTIRVAQPSWCPQRHGDLALPSGDAGPLRVVPGPHLGMAALTARVVDCSRIGVRLRVPRRRRVEATASMASLGVVPGTIQALPAGDWVVLGPDAGTMGGYPVVGVVASADLDRVGQLQPGQAVRLAPIGADGVPGPRAARLLRLGALG